MASEPHSSTIDPKEAAHFGAHAADWWDPNGSSAMLHKLGPVRLGFIRAAIDAHWGGSAQDLRPLAGKRVLDVGCGAGLVAEPLARMGGAVTAVDAAPENIAVAREHAAAMGLPIDYRNCGVETLADPQFDLITALEVIEHVTDPAMFLSAIARLLKPNGLLIISTPNRTPLSKLMVVTLAEGFGRIAKGTHHAARFITPEEMEALLSDRGLHVMTTKGLMADPRYGFVLSDNLSVNYILSAAFSSHDIPPSASKPA
ncbi:2-polyprenyl-6-hydroxyphenyl methylase/3-demethylubiquinone-9 3-methyltransferase [Sphingobium sp. B11D3B]|uniref:bifunctional 2-polyprenyl-6-hydroxyphenol methylase/3-demethylubiquinol 3-O-methyltransferase UbiG n=1 Tax=Sphingobium sp. B11D3B TaxID=2940575 RepID=UPI002227F175|nr:bifunctional 2-polyprenyl-6-hydroxyphenol methylase/3-demethylubiquinol 3-O-methyltransferase UbiG [Sphingobium sp. B11D3B]MCW2387895.1 2-polyprenyl-6-hydroxyphenyl methylase/3-demethylubiquinone-9 3-methyltransferase [Sphingobium sp. B11D3B]